MDPQECKDDKCTMEKFNTFKLIVNRCVYGFIEMDYWNVFKCLFQGSRMFSLDV